MTEIRHRETSEVLASGDGSVGMVLHQAVADGADLSDANLTGADLRDANLTGADLSGADMDGAKLSGADLTHADLSDSDMTGADLAGADLNQADLSQCEGLLDPIEWLADAEWTGEGLVVYKAEGGECSKPASWRFEPGAILREVVNGCRTTPCGSGVNAAKTSAWCRANYPDQRIWRCLIPVKALPSIVVPYGSYGNLRAGMVVLLKVLHDEEVTS